MANSSLLLAAVLVPILGACLLPLAGPMSARFRNTLALVLVLIPFLCCCPWCLGPGGGGPSSPPPGLSLGLMADGLVVLCAHQRLLGWTLFSHGYTPAEHWEYYFFVVLFIGAMMGITLSTNLIFLYSFWEISAVCCWRLIGFFREKEYVRRANKAFLITGAGALIMLGGFIAIYQQYGTFDLTVLRGQPVSSLAVALILFGILSKSATLPLHSWLADGGVAPTPATALLHAAVLVKIGVYVFTRLFVVNFQIAPVFHTIVPVIAAISALLSAGAAIREHDIKRIIAYSTVSQLGFILLGLSVGGRVVGGGLLYILMHAISKPGCSCARASSSMAASTKDTRRDGRPVQANAHHGGIVLLCAFSVMGLPPWRLLQQVHGHRGHGSGRASLHRHRVHSGRGDDSHLPDAGLYAGVLGQPREVHAHAKDSSFTMVASVGLLAALSLVSGLVALPADFVEQIVTQMAVIAQ